MSRLDYYKQIIMRLNRYVWLRARKDQLVLLGGEQTKSGSEEEVGVEERVD